ncbi:MAG: c-type cytochrome [Mucilaginibacter sp.]
MKLRVISGICLLLAVLIYSCQNEKSIEYKRMYTEGSEVYQTYCQNCHGNKGEGLAALIPPLTDITALKSNPTSLPCAVKFGLKGKITVSGKQFDSNMPASSELTPIQIAQVAIYVSNSFGNKNGFTSEDEVVKALNACK